MAFLRIDYEKAIAQAKELERAAELCGTSLNDLRRERNNSEAFWTGNAGNAMRGQMEASERELGNVKSQLVTIAADIRRVAEELKKKDMELKNRIGRFG